MFTERKAKRNEKKVLDLLNTREDHSFILHRNKYSHYDLGGTIDGVFTVIEIKERRQQWETWYIECEKLNNIYLQSAQEGFNWDTGYKYLCISVDGAHYFYNVDNIVQTPKITKKMNATTASGFHNQGVKVDKQVFEFPHHLYDFKISEDED